MCVCFGVHASVHLARRTFLILRASGFSVSHGVCVVDGGCRLWAVVKFVIVGGDGVGAHCCSYWCHGGVSCGACIVAGGRLWAVVVVVVTGWRWAVAAVGDGRCMCTGCGPWSSFVVCLLFRGRCGHLCSLVLLFVVVMGGRCRSQCGWSVVVCLDGGGKEKRNHVTLPDKHCLLSTTNK